MSQVHRVNDLVIIVNLYIFCWELRLWVHNWQTFHWCVISCLDPTGTSWVSLEVYLSPPVTGTSWVLLVQGWMGAVRTWRMCSWLVKSFRTSSSCTIIFRRIFTGTGQNAVILSLRAASYLTFSCVYPGFTFSFLFRGRAGSRFIIYGRVAYWWLDNRWEGFIRTPKPWILPLIARMIVNFRHYVIRNVDFWNFWIYQPLGLKRKKLGMITDEIKN